MGAGLGPPADFETAFDAHAKATSLCRFPLFREGAKHFHLPAVLAVPTMSFPRTVGDL